MDDKIRRRLSNPELRCKNKCGFYGNPIYMGYCSKCYKELVRDAQSDQREQQQGQRSFTVVGTPTHTLAPIDEQGGPIGSDVGATPPSPGDKLAFLRFNMKKKVQSAAKGHRLPALFKSTTPPVGEAKKGLAKKSVGGGRVVEPFSEFLKTLRKPAAQDIRDHLKSFRKQIMEMSTATIEEQSEAVLEFYNSMADHLKTHPLFRNMTEEQGEDMMDGIEKHLMTNIYTKVFSPPSSDDEMKDLLLQRRFRMLNWLEPSHLDVPLNLSNPEVQEQILKGQQDLWAMHEKKAPQDKLACFYRCCTHLLSALHISRDRPASADEFLPSLIFMVIYTSPQHLHSNVNYIQRFCNPTRLVSGEAGYYYTNLCGAISFIENISHENLRISEEEFNKNMGYVDGKTDTDLLLEEGDDTEDQERIMILKSCCQEMKIITNNLHKTLMEAKELSCRMSEFREGLRAQINSILSAPPARKPPPPLPPPPPAAAPQHVPDLIDLESSHEQTNNTSS